MSQYNVTLHRIVENPDDKGTPMLQEGIVSLDATDEVSARSSALAMAEGPVAGSTQSRVEWTKVDRPVQVDKDNFSMTWVTATAAVGPKSSTLAPASPVAANVRHGRSPIRRGVDALPAKVDAGSKPIATAGAATPIPEADPIPKTPAERKVAAGQLPEGVAPIAGNNTPPATVPAG